MENRLTRAALLRSATRHRPNDNQHPPC